MAETGTGLQGFVTDVVFGPVGSGTLYAATTEGVFRSDNRGRSWIAVGPTNASFITLAYARTTPPALYAATESNLYVSRDNGENWRVLVIGEEITYINLLVVDPTNLNVIYAGTGSSEVFRSTDCGENWYPISNGLNGVHVHALLVDPHAPSTLYAGTYGDGLYRSENAGESWSAINTGLPVYHIGVMAIDPVVPGTVYVEGDNLIIISEDRGESWRVLAYLGAVALTIDSTNRNILYAGGHGGVIFRSTDGGKRWRSLCVLPEDSIARSILIDPNSPSTIYVGTTYYGVYVVEIP